MYIIYARKNVYVFFMCVFYDATVWIPSLDEEPQLYSWRPAVEHWVVVCGGGGHVCSGLKRAPLLAQEVVFHLCVLLGSIVEDSGG